MIIIKNKKKNFRDKLKNIFKSYKTIIYISFVLNIILLLLCYYIMSNNKIYFFSGESENIKISDGIIALNMDINLLNGNNIEFIGKEDYNISSYKIGYYSIDDNKLVEIVSVSETLDEPIKMSNIINNFVSLSIFEKNSSNYYFTKYKKRLVDKELYFILEAKTDNGKEILEKIKLNITKITK